MSHRESKNSDSTSEDQAAYYLRSQGFQILSRNNRQYGAEIDVICSHPAHLGDIYFVEVKKRKQTPKHFPLMAKRQIARYQKAALSLQSQADRFVTVRIFVLLINPPDAIRHFEVQT